MNKLVNKSRRLKPTMPLVLMSVMGYAIAIAQPVTQLPQEKSNTEGRRSPGNLRFNRPRLPRLKRSTWIPR
jgi:hypothetical protein